MSKGKYNRKRQRAQEKAHREAEQIRLANNKVIAAKKQPKPSEAPNSDGNEKEQRNMVSREVPKRNDLTNWLLAIFTGILTTVAGFQWFVTNRQLDVMRNDQRAWIEVQEIPPDGRVPKVEVVAGKPIMYPIKVTNTGKTPAKDVKLMLAAEVVGFGNEPNFRCVEQATCSDEVNLWGIIFPSQANEISGRRWTLTGPAPVDTDADAAAWQEEAAYVAVYGMIDYVDVYKIHHWTKFCFWRNSPANGAHTHFNAKDCTEYNSVDSN
jgi:hypothetical protein